jgi:hypothetical protein
MTEEKAAKAFIEASMHKMYNPYHFVNLVKQAGAIPADAMSRAAVGWFMLNEIDYRYGVGDPVIGELASRVMSEVISDYEEVPTYNPGRGFEDGGDGRGGTWQDYESRYSPSFVRRGFDG